MNYERLIKLEKLIKESPILDTEEREEWLALLDLMNDKQLLELEKILQVQNKPAEEAKPELKPAVPILKPEVANKNEPSPTLAEVLARAKESKKEPETPKIAVPKLGHLMNLPKGFAGSKKSSTVVTPSVLLRNLQHTQALRPATVSVPEKKPETSKGAFWNKIKDILSEKELKPGRESVFTEKELPSGKILPQKNEQSVSQSSLLGVKPVIEVKGKIEVPGIQQKSEPKSEIPKVVFKPLPSLPKLQKFGLDIPVPKPKIRPQTVSLKLILKQSEKAQEQKPATQLPVSEPIVPKLPLAPVLVKTTGPTLTEQQKEIENSRLKQKTDFVAAIINKANSSDVRNISALKNQGVAEKEEIKVAAGVKLDEVHARSDSSRFFGSLKGLRPEDKVENISRTFQKIKLLTPKDLTKLTAENFLYEDEVSLVKSIKDFIKNFGYHEIVFAIEQSPLFISYINTGAKVLSGQAQFSEKGSGSLSSGILNQEEFEKIADLLMQIQTS